MKTKGVGHWWSHSGDWCYRGAWKLEVLQRCLKIGGAAEVFEDWRCCRRCWCAQRWSEDWKFEEL